MKEITVKIKNKAGLHARPSSMIVKVASNYECEVYLGTKNNMINAKSIMGVMTLGAGFGTELLLRTEGEDEQQALEEIQSLFENKFINE